MTRGQLRRMAELARDEGHEVRWEEARGGTVAPFRTIGGLAPLLRAARRIVLGDPFSRYVQLLLTITRAPDVVVVDDGTATMEFVSQLARGERLVRWHRKGGRPGPRDLIFAPVSSKARNRLTPAAGRRVEVFSSMPIDETPEGVSVTANDFAWTRARFGPPRITKGADLVGTSLVETGVVDGGPLPRSRPLPRHGPRRHPLLRPPPRERRETPHPRRGDGPGDRPPRPPPRTHRPPGPHRPYDPELPLDGGAHPAARARRNGRTRGGLRHRPELADGERLPPRPGLPVRGHGHGTGRPPAVVGGADLRSIPAAAPRARLPGTVFAAGASGAVASPAGPRLSCRVAGEGEVPSPKGEL